MLGCQRAILTIAVAILTTTFGLESQAQQVVWQIGAPDHDFAELALAGAWGAYAEHFADDPVFVVGKDEAKLAWPYIHPAPMDVWAGGRQHPFTIQFTASEPRQPYYELRIHLVSTHSTAPPLLDIRLNGRSWKVETQSGSGDIALNRAQAGKPQTQSLMFTGDLLKTTDNQLVITAEKGSWLLYDSIQLIAFDSLPEVEAITAQVQPFWFRQPDGDCRMMRVRFEGAKLTKPAKLSIRHNGHTVQRNVDPADQPLDFVDVLFPAQYTSETTSAIVSLRCDDEELTTQAAVKPERKWTVHLVHQTHLDIGYTHTQQEVLDLQMKHLRLALKTIDASKTRPPEERFKWHPEGMWAVDEFLRTAKEEEKQAFVEAARQLQIHQDVMYAQAMTGMYNEEELFELMGSAKRFEKKYGVPIISAMQSDVPGYTWGLATALVHHGVHYLSLGPNFGHRIGHTRWWGDRPFYWVTPDGKDKVLFWMTSGHYSWSLGSSTEQDFNESEVGAFLESLQEKGYPYDIVMIRYGLGGDNGPPNPSLPEQVKTWNAKHAYPKFTISTNSEVLREMERRHGAELPVVSGDFTPYWEDGCASTSADTAVNRKACERLVQAQNLWSMLCPDRPLHDRVFAAWEKLIMYDEHTWGAHNSISAPDAPFAVQQAEYKQNFALDGARMTEELVKAIVEDRHRKDSNTVDVYNTLNWPRSQLVLLSKQQSTAGDVVKDDRDQAVPSQRLASGELAFQAHEVPAFGARRYTLHRGTADSNGTARAKGLSMANDVVRLQIDPKTGAIASLRHKGLASDLAEVDTGKAAGLNDYLYHMGRDDKQGFERIETPPTVTVEDAGPLVATLRIESTAPGCKSLVRRVRVVDGSNRVHIANTTDKLKERRPEGVYFSYPFKIPGAVARVDIPWAVAQVEEDQIEGANRNYYCVQRWVDLSNDDYGVTWVTLDAPMLQFDPIKIAEAWGLQYWRTEIDPTPFIHSWVMNNHWETNYKADQEGIIRYRYVLAPHAGGYDAVGAQQTAREVHQPLIPINVDPDRPVPDPLLEVSGDGIVVTTVRPSQDGKAILVRLFNVADQPSTATVSSQQAGGTVWISNPMEEKLSRAPTQLELAKFEVVTLRLER